MTQIINILVFLLLLSCNSRKYSKFEDLLIDRETVVRLKSGKQKSNMVYSYRMCHKIDLIKDSKYLKSASIYFKDGTYTDFDIYELSDQFKKEEINQLLIQAVENSRRNIPLYSCPIPENSIHGFVYSNNKIYLFNSGVYKSSKSEGIWSNEYESLDKMILLQKKGV